MLHEQSGIKVFVQKIFIKSQLSHLLNTVVKRVEVQKVKDCLFRGGNFYDTFIFQRFKVITEHKIFLEILIGKLTKIIRKRFGFQRCHTCNLNNGFRNNSIERESGVEADI
jgi:hypothetical protein